MSRSGSLSVEEAIHEPSITRRLNWHIMTPFCMVTVLNHMDRANLAYASTQLNADLGFSDSEYGLGSGVFFLGYMVFQIPSQLVAERYGLVPWLSLLLMLWGAIATSFAGLTSSRIHLYILRFLLGAAEAGTFPAMFAYLTRFYAGGPELAAAWGFIGAAQPLAQVLGAPIAASLLMADGFLGISGWRWLFFVEGVPTIALGAWIGLSMASCPAAAAYLGCAEREFVACKVKLNREAVRKGTGEQHWTYGITCWKVWAQGLGSGCTGILRYGGMYWTPLIVYAIVYGRDSPSQHRSTAKGAASALLSGLPYSWAAIATLVNAWRAKKSGSMYWYLLWPLAVGAAGLFVLAVSLDHLPALAFIGLITSATSQASNPLEWSYPATYLHGAALSTGWALANCIAGYGGIVGPWMVGVVKDAYGSYVVPMLLLGLVNVCAVAYFAVLLRYLPVKSRTQEDRAVLSEGGEDVAALMDRVANTEAQ